MSRFCIIPVGMAKKFNTDAYIGIEIQLICVALNIEMYLVISTVSGNISKFGRKTVIWPVIEKEVR